MSRPTAIDEKVDENPLQMDVTIEVHDRFRIGDAYPSSSQPSLHCSSPYYSSYIAQHEHPTDSGEMSSETGRLLCLLAATGEEPSINRSFLYASTFAVHNTKSDSPDHPLLLGLFSTTPLNQIHTFRIAASHGSVSAMTHIGRCYRGFAGLSFSPQDTSDRPHLLMAVRWFLRAYRNGSVEAIQELALTYAELRDPIHAMHYFLLHLNRTQSLFSLIQIGINLRQWGFVDSESGPVRCNGARADIRKARSVLGGMRSKVRCTSIRRNNRRSVRSDSRKPGKEFRVSANREVSSDAAGEARASPAGGCE
jgi:hypothetical protein